MHSAEKIILHPPSGLDGCDRWSEGWDYEGCCGAGRADGVDSSGGRIEGGGIGEKPTRGVVDCGAETGGGRDFGPGVSYKVGGELGDDGRDWGAEEGRLGGPGVEVAAVKGFCGGVGCRGCRGGFCDRGRWLGR